MRHEFRQSAGLDSQLTGLLSSFLVVYFFAISQCNLYHVACATVFVVPIHLKALAKKGMLLWRKCDINSVTSGQKV